MNNKKRKAIALVLLFLISLLVLKNDQRNGGQLTSVLIALLQQQSQQSQEADGEEQDIQIIEDTDDTSAAIAEDGVYDSKDDVALYIYTYGKLPSNYITKKEAETLGWTGGSVEDYAPGKCIGGTYFGNYEGLLPEKSGRTYYECDIDTLGASSRGAKRIIYSSDGLIYYTDDHYESFTLLYGEP